MKKSGASTSTPQIPATKNTIFANFILPPTHRAVLPSLTVRGRSPRALPRQFRPSESHAPPPAGCLAPASARTSETRARNPRDFQSARGIAPPPRLCRPRSGIPVPGRSVKMCPWNFARRILPASAGGSSFGRSWRCFVLYVEVRPAQTLAAAEKPARSPLGSTIRHISIPSLEFWPRFGKGNLEVVAHQDVVVLPTHAVIRCDARALLNSAAPILRIIHVPFKQDDPLAAVIARAPIVVILMSGNGLGQTVACAEEVDRSRSAVVAR